MKLSDVEYQADKSKATFFYSAEERVDFRDLIKRLADEFRVRIEMRQISLRHEAGRLGGIGSCGRELCCSTWLSDFRSVSTTAARYQNLSLNPSKLSGQCGRLKCCLNYELETYMDALKDIPTVAKPLLTHRGEAVLQKTDIFKKVMWFGYKDDNNWYPVPVERVREIINLNAKGVSAETLTVEEQKEISRKIEFAAKLEGNLERLDEKFKGKTKKKKKKKNRNLPQETSAINTSSNMERSSDAIQPTLANAGTKPVQGATLSQGRPMSGGNRPEGNYGNKKRPNRNNNRPPKQATANRPPSSPDKSV
jgi:cell fate regulator YaaT (PSP1 superfamily)